MILVTGGGGLVGLNLARELADRGQEVLLLSWVHDRYKPDPPSFLSSFWGKEVVQIEGDVVDWSSLIETMTKYPIDSIIHAAGTWPGRAGATSLYHTASVDIMGTLNILEAGRLFGVRRVTFISSIGVYFGLPERMRIDETVDLPATHPDFVATTKKASEQICNLYLNFHRMDLAIIRLARVYGPGAHWGANPLERMVMHASKGIPLDCPDVYEGGYVCPIHAKDCAKGISVIHLAKELGYAVHNLADGNCVTNQQLADIVREIFPNAEIRLATTKQSDPSFPFDLDLSRIRQEGWTPEYSDLRKGIQAYGDYVRYGKY
jgi:UDP-glucuronate 4-epimerase